MQTVGLFEAKTNLSAYVLQAEAGDEIIITRHNKPVAKIVSLQAAPAVAAPAIPRFVQRVFSSGGLLVDMSKANELLAELDNEAFLEKIQRGA